MYVLDLDSQLDYIENKLSSLDVDLIEHYLNLPWNKVVFESVFEVYTIFKGDRKVVQMFFETKVD